MKLSNIAFEKQIDMVILVLFLTAS